jgi:cytochrome P450
MILRRFFANAEIDGAPLPPFERTGYYTIIATAGHDTTSSSTAGAMWALATQPGLLERVQSGDPALMAGTHRRSDPLDDAGQNLHALRR